MAIGTSVSTTTQQYGTQKTDVRAMSIATMLFFMWGFLTCLNDILIPHLKGIFDLNYAQAMLVQFCFFSSYFIFALPSGKLVEWVGYKQAMVVGLLVMAAGAFLFLPASTAASFGLFLSALIILAAGITCLQVAANPYVTVLGKPETASSRLNLTQAFNSLGTFLAPFFGGLFILSAAPKAIEEIRAMAPDVLQAYRLHEAATVKTPYVGLGIALVVLAIAIGSFKLPTIEHAQHKVGEKVNDSIWKHPNLIFGAIGIFVYVGAEVSIGSFLVNYFSQPNIGNMTEKAAALYVAFYWGGAMIGRFCGAGITQKLRAGPVLGVAAVVACCLVITSMTTFGHVAMWSIILVGLFNSIMWPNIFALGLAELGRLTNLGSSLLVMGVLGAALIPLLQGFVADKIGIHHAFFLPALCYVYICYYGFKGSKVRHAEATA